MIKEAFEHHFGPGSKYGLSLKKDQEGDYTSYDTTMAWEGWIAAMSHCMQTLLEEPMPELDSISSLSGFPEEDGEAFRRNVSDKLFGSTSPLYKG